MARGGSAWPRTMLAAGSAASPIAVRPVAGSRVPSFPDGRGMWIMAPEQAVEELDLGIVPAAPRSRRTRGPCRPWAAAAVMLLPHTRNASTFVGCFTRDYQRRR